MPKKKKRKNEKKVNPVWNAVFWISLVAFVVLAAVVGYIVYGYWTADKGYQDVANVAFNEQNQESLPENPTQEVEDADLVSLAVDWEYLRSVNPDIVAWVYMPGTKINYPVVQGRDNDEYLHRDFSYADGFTARGGAIFMDAANSPDFTDDNTFIYGHHMNDGSMFACLSAQLEDQAEFNSHRYIYVLTPSYNYKCRSFALALAKGTEEIVQVNFPDYPSRIEYLSDIISRSVVTPEEGRFSPEAVGQIFTFATCDYNQSNGRAMLYSTVVAQVIPDSSSNDKISSERQSGAQVNIGTN